MEVAEYYNQFYSRKYSSFKIKFNRFLKQRAIKYSYVLGGKLNGKNILEIGVGSGIDAIFFKDSGAKVTAIDISKTVLGLVKNFAVTICGRAENIRLNQKFDLIYINNSLMFMDRKLILTKYRKNLKKGGKIVIVEPLKYHPLFFILRKLSSCGKIKPDYITLRELTCLSKGFKSFEHKEFYLTFLPILDDIIFRIFPKSRNLALMSVARFIS
jgi:SAM-dependent methyltransferase